MDFENAQLLAEVSMATVPSEFEWDNDTIMQFSGAAELRQYAVNFIRSEFKQFDFEPTNVLIWRDTELAFITTAWKSWISSCLARCKRGQIP